MRRWLSDLQAVMPPFLDARRPLLVGALLACSSLLAGMALLGLSGWFITATGLAGLSMASAYAFDVFAPSAGIRLLAIGRTASRYGERLVTHDATFAVLAALRARLFLGWAQPGAARELVARPSRWLFRLTADIDALESLYLRLGVPALAALGAALLAGGVLGVLDMRLGAIFAAWLLATGFGLALAVGVRAVRPAVRRGHALETLRERTIDLVAGQTDLVMAGRIGAQGRALAEADLRLARADLALNRLETAAGAAYGVVGVLGLASVLLAVAWLAAHGAIGAPAAALGLLIALTAAEPFAALRRGALDVGRTWLAVRRLAPRLRAESASSELEGSVVAAIPDFSDMLTLENVTARHGSGVAVLHDISLTVQAGERVALIGASGAGKSTVLALVAGEIAPMAGRAHAVPACLFTQRTELFQDTLRDNLRLADPAADDAALWRALEGAGLAKDIRA
ncbi:MAG: ATP-binding cassette domain-containing protein, partial [Comamonadaceae bacterium]